MDTIGRLSLRFLSVVFAQACIVFLAASAFCAVDPVARLTHFSGTVLIRSHGSWDVEPKKNLPLYSNDKVVTQMGEATITFNDGAVVIVKQNTNLRIDEREQEGGILKGVRKMKRRFRLLLGKMTFSSGKREAETAFETPTAVCGIRGTVLALGIGPEGQSYIQFTEGGAKFLVGDFIRGIPVDVPMDMADRNPAQRAVYVAKAAADQAKKAAAKAAAGDISQAQAALSSAEAAEAAANEALIGATLMAESNPDPEVVERAREEIAAALERIKEAIDAKKDAIANGAKPDQFEDEEPDADVKADDEPPVQRDPASDV
jgi:hypothetical protein